MTREEAKDLIQITKGEFYPYNIIDNVDDIIDQIFDHFEAQLKFKDDDIAKLEVRLIVDEPKTQWTPTIEGKANNGLTYTSLSDEIMTHEEAIAEVVRLNAENFGGFSDWRLPELDETTAKDPNGVPADVWTWTATSFSGSTYSYWYWYGANSNSSYYGYYNYVRCIR